MDFYPLMKFLHVASAIAWVGGGGVLTLLAVLADRAKNDSELVAIARHFARAGERIYMPATAATLITGVIATTLGGMWGSLWIIIAMLGIVVSGGIGGALLSPRGKRINTLADGGDISGAARVTRELLLIARFDLVLLFAIVADMVFKPYGMGDWLTLVLMAAAIAGAAAMFLLPMRQTAPA
ncbi:MAG: hypothetical protein JWR75_81 [Devosia sp.]|nr:hypothetical protein [Devosia sp.]